MADSSQSASVEISQPPQDAVTNVTFAPVPGDYSLLVSSWDAKVRIYDTAADQLKGVHEHKHAVLDCTFLTDSQKCVSGGLSTKVLGYDFVAGEESVIGHHREAVRVLRHQKSTGLVLSGSWDGTVKAWDTRTKTCTADMQVDGKVYVLDVTDDRVVVGTSKKQLLIYDSRNLAQPQTTRDQPLKFQFRCLRCFPDGKGYALSSTEGRIAWHYFDQSAESQANEYAFKCHRKTVDNVETVYPVHALAFHGIHGTFASGGGDGMVSVWDGRVKKRLWKIPDLKSSVSSLSFSADGTRLAISVSYQWEEGFKDDPPPNQLIVRTLEDVDVRPKEATA